MSEKPLLIVVVGPTAVGKTTLSIQLAQQFKAEIISADSRQFYREMNIGTAKPTQEELSSAPHHLVNHLSIHDDYSVGQFEKEASVLLDQIFKKQRIAILVGGSGLYVDALCHGLDEFPSIDIKFREELNLLFKEEGILPLQEQLAEKDPDYYQVVDQQNPQRLIRALEVIMSTGKTFTSFRKRKKIERPYDVLKIGLRAEREEIYDRINQRMDLMIDQGLFEEAESLFAYRELNALQTVGYQEIFGYLEGEYDKEEAIRLLKRNSRRYAKRQLTWFNRDDSIHWFEPSDTEEILSLIEQKIKSV